MSLSGRAIKRLRMGKTLTDALRTSDYVLVIDSRDRGKGSRLPVFRIVKVQSPALNSAHRSYESECGTISVSTRQSNVQGLAQNALRIEFVLTPDLRNDES